MEHRAQPPIINTVNLFFGAAKQSGSGRRFLQREEVEARGVKPMHGRSTISKYSEEAIERLKLVKKFQGIGCSIAELKEVLQDHDTQRSTREQIIEWIRNKMSEIERKKEEYDHMLETLNKMLEYRMALTNDPQKRVLHWFPDKLAL